MQKYTHPPFETFFNRLIVAGWLCMLLSGLLFPFVKLLPSYLIIVLLCYGGLGACLLGALYCHLSVDAELKERERRRQAREIRLKNRKG